jgi:hypothetical protein
MQAVYSILIQSGSQCCPVPTGIQRILNKKFLAEANIKISILVPTFHTAV